MAAVSFTIPVVMVRFGKDYLTALLPIYLITGNVFAESFLTVFGVFTSLAIPVYAATFLITDILSEHYGKHDSRRAVWVGLIGQAVFLMMLVAVINAPIIPTKLAAYQTALGKVGWVVFGSFIAYLASQFLDVHLYHRIMNWTGKEKAVWLRNNLATITAQTVDTTIFIWLAFGLPEVIFKTAKAPTFGTAEKLWWFILTTALIKAAVAIFDTPFLYWARRVGKRSGE